MKTGLRSLGREVDNLLVKICYGQGGGNFPLLQRGNSHKRESRRLPASPKMR